MFNEVVKTFLIIHYFKKSRCICLAIGVKNIYMLNLSLLKPLMPPGIVLGKSEVIKRFRKFYGNHFLLQMLAIFPFSFMGKNEKGEIFYC
jgi:hypothetical protein